MTDVGEVLLSPFLPLPLAEVTVRVVAEGGLIARVDMGSRSSGLDEDASLLPTDWEWTWAGIMNGSETIGERGIPSIFVMAGLKLSSLSSFSERLNAKGSDSS